MKLPFFHETKILFVFSSLCVTLNDYSDLFTSMNLTWRGEILHDDVVGIRQSLDFKVRETAKEQRGPFQSFLEEKGLSGDLISWHFFKKGKIVLRFPKINGPFSNKWLTYVCFYFVLLWFYPGTRRWSDEIADSLWVFYANPSSGGYDVTRQSQYKRQKRILWCHTRTKMFDKVPINHSKYLLFGHFLCYVI